MNLLALLITPDRVIVSPIPDQVVTDWIIHNGSRMPFSSGFVSCWEGYCLTDWKWEISVTQGFDGRMKREFEGIVLGELPRKMDVIPVICEQRSVPTGVYCPGLKRICGCEKEVWGEPVIFDRIIDAVVRDDLLRQVCAVWQVPVKMLGMAEKPDKQKERCPYNPSSPGCGANSCSDNPNCPEKPWVKGNVNQDYCEEGNNGAPFMGDGPPVVIDAVVKKKRGRPRKVVA